MNRQRRRCLANGEKSWGVELSLDRRFSRVRGKHEMRIGSARDLGSWKRLRKQKQSNPQEEGDWREPCVKELSATAIGADRLTQLHSEIWGRRKGPFSV